MKPIADQWLDFYNLVKKAKFSNMMDFAESLGFVDIYNEPVYDFLTLKKIPIIYVTKDRMDNPIIQKIGISPRAVFWCTYAVIREKEHIFIFVNLLGKNLIEIARVARVTDSDLNETMSSILTHESIHAYLLSIGYQFNMVHNGKAVTMIGEIMKEKGKTSNPYILERLPIIAESNSQEIFTYFLTEKILSDFLNSIQINDKNGWIAFIELVNEVDPYGILVKYGARFNNIPDHIISDAEIKFRLFKMKGDYIKPKREEITLKLKEGGIITFDASMGGKVGGKSHDEGGVKAVIKETGQNVELEKNEAVIKKTVVLSKRKYNFEGKKQEPRQILNKLNTDGGGNKI